MQFIIHLRVALGLLAIGSAVASPCKPLSATTTSAITSAVTSEASTETSLVTSHASSTEDVEATSSTVVESSTDAFISSTETTASAETSDSSITIETSAATTTMDYTAETTTAEPTTTVAETTSSAAIPTFTMFASGSNAVAGNSLETYDRDSTVAVFDPATEDDNPSARQYSIDSQGRIVNDLGWYLCGYYGATNEELNKPATVVTCHTQIALQTAFLTCELSGPFGIECSVPAMSCVSSGSSSMPPTCIPSTGAWSLNSVGVRAFGHTWQIGGSDTPANYERMTMSIREVRA